MKKPSRKSLYWLGGVYLTGTLGYLLLRSTGPRLRARVISAAMKEQPAPDAVKYWNDVLIDPRDPPKEWCGAFALYALHRAGLARSVPWERGRGFLFLLPRTSSPSVGDIAYFDQNQHHALVKSVNSDGTVTLINGNAAGGSISISHPKRSSVSAFYSIQPFVVEALA